jgi:hypothetical protein
MNFDWIFCHRGIWKNTKDQNSPKSFNLAAKLGFSSEIDLRLSGEQIYISHDPKSEIDDFRLDKYDLINNRFAFNIKSDGIYKSFSGLKYLLDANASFVFDGSIPEMFQYKQMNIPHALRLSEYESQIPWEVDYIWVDGFQSDWWLKDKNFNNYLDNYNLIFVSPEIHKRDYNETWEWILNKRQSGYSNLNICTDKPIELSEISTN